MAYNPFDDVILQDPAYMSNGGDLNFSSTQQVMDQPFRGDESLAGSKVAQDIQKKVITPFATSLYNLLGAGVEQKDLDRLAMNQSLMNDLISRGIGLEGFENVQKGSQEYYDLVNRILPELKKMGYQEADVLKSLQTAVYGPQKMAFGKLSQGQELTEEEQAMANPLYPLIDMFDVALPVAAISKRLAQAGMQLSDDFVNFIFNAKQKGHSPEMIQNIAKNAFPDEYRQATMLTFRKPEGMETSQIMRAPDDGGAGGGLTGKAIGLSQGPAAIKEQSYGYLKKAFNDFKKTKPNIISPNTFYNYLNEQGIKLKVGEKTKKSGLTHLRKAIEYLDPETEVLSGKYLPWMFAAENILKTSDKTLTSRDLYKELKKQGFDEAEQNKIEGWAKSGANIQDKSLLKKLKITPYEKYSDNVREEKVNSILSLITQLENDPSQAKKGFKEYSINVPSEQRDINMKNIMAGINKGTSKNLINDLGSENIEKLNSLIGKPDEVIESLFNKYIPVSQKKPYNLYNIGTYKIKQAYRDGTFQNSDNFEDVMASYGILKKDSPYYVQEDNQKRIQQLIDDLEMLDTPMEKNAYMKIFNESKELSDYAVNKYKETIMSSPALQERLLTEYQKFDPEADLEIAINQTAKAFGGHISHIYRIDDFAGKNKKFKKGMKGMGTISNMLRVNFGIENLGLQKTAENVLDANIQAMNRAFKKGDMEQVEKLADVIKQYDELLTTKGMAAYRRLSKKSLTPEVIAKLNEVLGKNAAGTIRKIRDVTIDGQKVTGEGEVSAKYNDVLIGSNVPQTVTDQKMRMDNLMAYFLENPQALKIDLRDPLDKSLVIDKMRETPYSRKGFLNLGTKDIIENSGFKKGGPVHMALGGDPLENLNQQQFTPDPAMDDDFFAKAVQDENLYAFNPMNLFKSFKKVPAMFTPDKNKTLMDITPDATTGLPVVQRTELNDFPFQSHFIQTLSEKGIPNADTTKGWKNLFTGTKGFSQSELKDAGIFDYLEDADKFIPGAKITKEDLLRVYENSPIANIEIKVKDKSPLPDTLPISGEYKEYMGGPKHEGIGSAQIDEGGTDYRNIIINVKKLPGEKKPFFNASHYEKDPNVLAFTRVANYKNANGQDVAVIQELQTDLLTNLKKEQERLAATMKIVRRQKNSLKEQIQNYPASAEYYQQELDKLEMQYPESKIKFLEETNLVRPTDPVFAEKLAPELTKDLNDIQEQINNLTKANLKEVVDPDYVNKIVALQNEGREKFNRLYELNRQANYDLMLENVDVVDARTSDEILRAGENQSYVPRNNPVQTFPNIPFNKGPDWIDMMLKATIQDAQSRGINKVAIMPSDIVNMRWNKDPDSQAGEKFKTIYDKISVQELKNIAKKYTGNKNNLQIEQIVDPTKTDKGLTFLNKAPDGEFQVLKQLEAKKQIPINERDDFYDEEIARIVRSFEDKSVVYSREIAPGQTMDYYVLPTTKGDAETGKVFGYRLEPLGDGDNVNDALLKIEEYNPSLKNMYTITLPEETTKKGPMFLFRKKDGGKIDTDGLVSITDIYGDY